MQLITGNIIGNSIRISSQFFNFYRNNFTNIKNTSCFCCFSCCFHCRSPGWFRCCSSHWHILPSVASTVGSVAAVVSATGIVPSVASVVGFVAVVATVIVPYVASMVGSVVIISITHKLSNFHYRTICSKRCSVPIVLSHFEVGRL